MDNINKNPEISFFLGHDLKNRLADVGHLRARLALKRNEPEAISLALDALERVEAIYAIAALQNEFSKLLISGELPISWRDMRFVDWPNSFLEKHDVMVAEFCRSMIISIVGFYQNSHQSEFELEVNEVHDGVSKRIEYDNLPDQPKSIPPVSEFGTSLLFSGLHEITRNAVKHVKLVTMNTSSTDWRPFIEFKIDIVDGEIRVSIWNPIFGSFKTSTYDSVSRLRIAYKQFHGFEILPTVLIDSYRSQQCVLSQFRVKPRAIRFQRGEE